MFEKEIKHQLNRIESMLILLLKRGGTMNETTQQILDAVTAETALEQGVLTLITNLQSQLSAALANTTISAQDQQNLNTIFADLQSNSAALSAALTANTPAAPAQESAQ